MWLACTAKSGAAPGGALHAALLQDLGERCDGLGDDVEGGQPLVLHLQRVLERQDVGMPHLAKPEHAIGFTHITNRLCIAG